MPLNRRPAGFTLVELSIVLIVVGLLAAGLLVSARAMIQRGQVADLIAKVRDLAAASRNFKTRYSFFPGDLPNAASFELVDDRSACSYAPAGLVGNGLVDTALESTCALEHLRLAGLLAKLDFANGAYRIAGPGGATVSLWYNAANKENAVRIQNLACDLALELDAKMDTASATGTPLSEGQVQGRDGSEALSTCVAGQSNDPVASVLIRY